VNLTRERRLVQVTAEGAPSSAEPAILLAHAQRLRDLKVHAPCDVYAPTQLVAKRLTTVCAAPQLTRRIEIPRLDASAR
jgi:hypothetical protein